MFAHIFSFLFGVFSVVISVVYMIVRFLETAQANVDRTEFKDVLAKAAQDRAEMRSSTSRFNSEKRGRVLIKKPDDNSSSEIQEWYHCVLKTNMLFLFKHATDTSAVGILCIDGCVLSVIRNKTSKFHKKNGIAIMHAERELLFHSKVLNFYLENGKELETWFWFLREAASITLKKTQDDQDESKRSQQFFLDLPSRASVPSVHQATFGSMHNGAAASLQSPTGQKKSTTGTSSPKSPATPLVVSPNQSLSSALEDSIMIERSINSSPTVSNGASSPQQTAKMPPSSLKSISSLLPTLDGQVSGPSASQYDWLNVLVGRVFFNLYDTDELLAFVSSKITKKLNKLKKPSILKSITLQNLEFGPNLPILQDAELMFITPQGEMSVDLVVNYHGGLTLTIKIEVSFSIRGRTISIPLVISVLVKSLHGRMNLQCLPPPTKRVWVGFYEEPECEIEIDTSIGESKTFSYLNMPKIAKMIVNKLKSELFDMMVLPNREDWPLPTGNKRKKKSNNDIPSATPPPIPSALGE
ncbi:hypothetical protein SAMD00019534_071300 [Acytostelium subglobosum LB1]|uniref:hypothetical protein n=1 Tax=Acytostelium subglobosum LB1 TaxID=1410327 RepID=UPI0006451A94|nr:hypothetical protein SAMD00019534_071300 [Acytostelium subglobosum LB1]GAM23955.1 hypothetical protein SAMD00019534_071300 [Acytostelium subglobosum LB1]|eukprot:XP_012752991.1 hypothetical protein SAMD00019534_071300 [Acytostelium subglobosum LB1]